MIGEKVRDNIVTILQNHPTSNFAALGSIGILSRIEKWEEMELPGHSTTCLYNVWLRFELDTTVMLPTMDSKFVFCGEGTTTLRTSHLESSLKSDILVIVDLHLTSVVLAVLLLSQLVLDCLAMLFKLIFAHETLDTSTALVPPLSLYLVIRAERAGSALGHSSLWHNSLLLQRFLGLFDDSVNQALLIVILFLVRLLLPLALRLR